MLNEALRDDLPLLERMKFLAITASNLDEFFQVRIGGLLAMKRGGMKKPDASGLTPTRNLAVLRERILRMTKDQYALFNEALVPALRAVVAKPILARLGGRLRLAVVGGAALDPVLARTSSLPAALWIRRPRPRATR